MGNGTSLEGYVSNLTNEDAPAVGNNIADTSKYVRDTTFPIILR